MQIKGLHIYGFGQHIDKQIELRSGDIHVFYGENEAGKSTIMAFISALLFGLPKKGPHLPKQGSKYGGHIKLATKQNELMTIERTLTQTRVYFSDGRSADEQQLQTLYQGMDAAVFQAIFFFDLSGLQDIQAMRADDLGKFLFSSSVTGDQSLTQLERNLDQRLDNLFKPNGKKPVINEQLAVLEKMQQKIVEWDQKLASYAKLEESMEDAARKRDDLDEQKKKNDFELKQLRLKLSLQPFMIEQQKWTHRLKQLPEYDPFPEDGLARFDLITTELLTLKTQAASLEKKRAEAVGKLDSIQIDQHLLARESQLQKLSDHRQMYERDKQELQQVVAEEKQRKAEIIKLIDKLGIDKTEIEVLRIDTSIAVRELVKHHVKQESLLVQTRTFLDARFTEIKQLMDENEAKINYYQEQGRKVTQNSRNSLKIMLFTAPFFLAIILYFMLGQTDMTEMILVTLAWVVTIVFQLKAFFVKENIELENETLQLEQNETRLNQVITELEEWEESSNKHHQELALRNKQLCLPKLLTGEQLLEAMEWLISLKETIRIRQNDEDKVIKLTKQVSHYEQELQRLAGQCGQGKDEIGLLLVTIKSIISKEKEKELDRKHLQQKVAELTTEMIALHEQITVLGKERDKLYAVACATNEEAFRIKGKANQEAKRILEQLSMIDSQISALVNDQDSVMAEIKTENSDYGLELEQLERQNEQLEEERNREHEKLTDYKFKLAHLRDGEDYSTLFHQQETNKSILRQYAKKWAAAQLAKDVLLKTKDDYLKNRLPKVTEQASVYFDFLTNGGYCNILVDPQTQSFTVERKDGVHFMPQELSRATAEQLYLSIRFALAHVYPSKSPYPIMIDDGFVNFDDKRTEKTMILLREMAKKHQILFFTCHKHVLTHFSENAIIKL